MSELDKYQLYQLVKQIPAWLLASLAALFILLVPGVPFRGEPGHWIEYNDRSHGRSVFHVYKIYSLVRSHRVDLSDVSAWAIARTVLEESVNHSLDPILTLAVIRVESRFEPAAVSHRGARGLMQILPSVGNVLVQERKPGLDNYKENFTPEALHDPVLNIQLGVLYLGQLKRRFRDVTLALTAYNMGPTGVRNILQENQEVPLGYAARVLSVYSTYRKETRRPYSLPRTSPLDSGNT